MSYVASVPYSGAQPEQAGAWVEDNVGTDASAEFAGVPYTLYANAETRMLEIRAPSTG